MMEIFSFENIMYVFFYFAVSRYGPRCEEKAGGGGGWQRGQGHTVTIANLF